MAIVNFHITPVLEKQINQVIKQDGFSSKAEFFRLTALDYIKKRQEAKDKLSQSVRRLEKALEKKFKNVDWDKWPSLEEQMKDLL